MFPKSISAFFLVALKNKKKEFRTRQTTKVKVTRYHHNRTRRAVTKLSSGNFRKEDASYSNDEDKQRYDLSFKFEKMEISRHFDFLLMFNSMCEKTIPLSFVAHL